VRCLEAIGLRVSGLVFVKAKKVDNSLSGLCVSTYSKAG
jgi:hypothetical protein